jgi:hypothetical protein
LSAPFVVFALAVTLSVLDTSSPLPVGPPTGTAISAGGEHGEPPVGSPSAATAASSPLVSTLRLPSFALNVIADTCAGAFGQW